MSVREKKLKNKEKEIAQEILREVKILRREISVLLPSEDLNDYTSPTRLSQSYKKAIKQYPPEI